jgi:hypothetical protein
MIQLSKVLEETVFSNKHEGGNQSLTRRQKVFEAIFEPSALPDVVVPGQSSYSTPI